MGSGVEGGRISGGVAPTGRPTVVIRASSRKVVHLRHRGVWGELLCRELNYCFGTRVPVVLSRAARPVFVENEKVRNQSRVSISRKMTGIRAFRRSKRLATPFFVFIRKLSKSTEKFRSFRN